MRDDRPMAPPDSAKRERFRRTSADLVLAAFDEAARFDAERAGDPSPERD